MENAVTERMDPDRFIGVQSKIVVDEAYVKGLEGLETGMELLILFAFHLFSGAPLMVHPRGDTSRKKRGVFATCSPNRPNGIGTGHCKLLGCDGNILVVEDLIQTLEVLLECMMDLMNLLKPLQITTLILL